jgi:hypothetical protein
MAVRLVMALRFVETKAFHTNAFALLTKSVRNAILMLADSTRKQLKLPSLAKLFLSNPTTPPKTS